MTLLFLITLLVLITYYVAVVIIMLIGTARLQDNNSVIALPSRESGKSGPNHSFVSVLVAARNEEDNIEKCLTSLVNQDFSVDKHEIVVVNDRSTDRTSEIIATFQTSYSNIVSLNIKTDPPIGMTGKQHAILHGLEQCNGEIIFNTDADCVVPRRWISTMLNSFDDNTGFVMGYPLAHARHQLNASLFTKLQSLDLVHLVNHAAGCVGWGKPVTCIGNNIAYRKQAIEDIGGYSTLRYTLTEDAALIQAISKNTDWNVRVTRHKDSVIITKPAANMRQLYHQRNRWILGAQDTGTRSVILLHLTFWFYLLLLISLPVSVFLGLRALLLLSGCVFVKLLLDFCFCWSICKRIKRMDLLKYFLPYEAFLLFNVFWIGCGSMFARSVAWKGQKYPRGAKG